MAENKRTFANSYRLEKVYYENMWTLLNVLKALKENPNRNDSGAITELLDNAIADNESIIIIYKNLGELYAEIADRFTELGKELKDLRDSLEDWKDEINEKIDDVNNTLMTYIREIWERLDAIEADLASLQRNIFIDLVYDSDTQTYSLERNGETLDFDDITELCEFPHNVIVTDENGGVYFIRDYGDSVIEWTIDGVDANGDYKEILVTIDDSDNVNKQENIIEHKKEIYMLDIDYSSLTSGEVKHDGEVIGWSDIKNAYLAGMTFILRYKVTDNAYRDYQCIYEWFNGTNEEVRFCRMDEATIANVLSSPYLVYEWSVKDMGSDTTGVTQKIYRDNFVLNINKGANSTSYYCPDVGVLSYNSPWTHSDFCTLAFHDTDVADSIRYSDSGLSLSNAVFHRVEYTSTTAKYAYLDGANSTLYIMDVDANGFTITSVSLGGSSYSAGNGIDISNDTISIKNILPMYNTWSQLYRDTFTMLGSANANDYSKEYFTAHGDKSFTHNANIANYKAMRVYLYFVGGEFQSTAFNENNNLSAYCANNLSVYYTFKNPNNNQTKDIVFSLSGARGAGMRASSLLDVVPNKGYYEIDLTPLIEAGYTQLWYLTAYYDAHYYVHNSQDATVNQNIQESFRKFEIFTYATT